MLALPRDVARVSRRDRPVLRPRDGHRLLGASLHLHRRGAPAGGLLITGSAVVIWGLTFILGLECGIEGAYFSRSVGAPSSAGTFAAWCDLREVIPYAFGYMMAAKVGTGIVAELGAMRISDEIDALEVMGVNPMIFLCATRLLAAWIVLPFIYLVGIGVGYFASWLAHRQAGRRRLVRRLLRDLLGVPEPSGPGLQPHQGHGDGHRDRGRRLLLRLQRVRRPRRRREHATAKSMVLNIVLVHVIGMLGTLVFWGTNPRAPIGG